MFLQAELLTGRQVATVEDAHAVVPLLLARGCRVVVVTLGERGAVLGTSENPGKTQHVPAPSVKARDTTVSLAQSSSGFRHRSIDLQPHLEGSDYNRPQKQSNTVIFPGTRMYPKMIGWSCWDFCGLLLSSNSQE